MSGRRMGGGEMASIPRCPSPKRGAQGGMLQALLPDQRPPAGPAQKLLARQSLERMQVSPVSASVRSVDFAHIPERRFRRDDELGRGKLVQIPMSPSALLTCAIVAVRSGCETSKRVTATRSWSMMD